MRNEELEVAGGWWLKCHLTLSPLPLEGAAWRSETGLAPPYVENTFPRIVIPKV